jgi:hypothetical protein
VQEIQRLTTRLELLREDNAELLAALRLVLLFYTIDWTEDKKAEWQRITGATEATTKVMCDYIHAVIIKAEST